MENYNLTLKAIENCLIDTDQKCEEMLKEKGVVDFLEEEKSKFNQDYKELEKKINSKSTEEWLLKDEIDFIICKLNCLLKQFSSDCHQNNTFNQSKPDSYWCKILKNMWHIDCFYGCFPKSYLLEANYKSLFNLSDPINLKIRYQEVQEKISQINAEIVAINMDNLDKNEEYKNINELLQGVRGYQMTEEKENNNDINPKDSMDYSKGEDKYHYEYYEEITYQN